MNRKRRFPDGMSEVEREMWAAQPIHIIRVRCVRPRLLCALTLHRLGRHVPIEGQPDEVIPADRPRR